VDSTPTTTILRDPKVYLVGRQQVDEAAISAFLGDHDVVRWSTDTDEAGEKLVEVAGRLCYMSFARPRPGGNNAYISHILEVGHGSVLEHAVFNLIITGVSRSFTHELVRHRAGFGYCLTGDTLIYSDHRCRGRREGTTKRTIASLYEMQNSSHGRSRLKLLRPRCLDESTGEFINNSVHAIAYSGPKEVYRLTLEDGKTISCSKDHRFLTREGWQSLDEVAGGLCLLSNQVVSHGPLTTPIAVNGCPAYQDADWLRREYHDRNRKLAEIAADCGVTVAGIRNWVRKFGLSKKRGSWSLGVTPPNKGRRYQAGWHHTDETKAKLAAAKQGELNPGWRGGTTSVGVKLRRGVDLLRSEVLVRDQYRCRLCGCGGFLEIHHILPIWARPDLAIDPANLAAVCISCHDRMAGRELEFVDKFGQSTPTPESVPERPKGRGNKLVPRWRKIKSIEYAGIQDTYDLEMDAPHHNFVANGIVTHNSQLSQRFVDESECAFVEPDAIAEDPELHAIWLQAIEQSQSAYRLLADGLAARFASIEDRTLRRKKAREAARSVLPNATETKIFVTGNARALRHFIEMRGDAAADVEIRKVALAVLRLLQAESPNLFGDYAIIDLAEGGQAATTAHPKV
jgi:thymidylate synthase ThyX